MTKIFEGQNNLSSRTAFEQRKAYKQAISDPEIDFIDTWYENPRYGLLNSNYDPVVFLPGDSRENLQNFGDYAPEEAIAAPFIVKAFNDFREVNGITTLVVLQNFQLWDKAKSRCNKY